MVKRTIEQKIRTRSFQARSEEERNGSCVKESKGEKRWRKRIGWNAINGKRQDSVEDDTTVVSATMKLREEELSPKSVPSCEPKKPRCRNPFRKLPRKPCRDDPQGKCTPECHIDKKHRGQDSVKNVFLEHHQVEGQPDKQPRKNGDNTTVALLMNSNQLGCVLPDIESPR